MTDASGEVYQHLEYFAFGETFVEEHSNTDRTPYLYNGKELDEETGLYCGIAMGRDIMMQGRVCGWEWIRKQVNMPELSDISHVDYEKSHDKAENKVNGNKRIEDGSDTDIFKDNGTKTSQTISPTASGSVTITKLLSLN
jgi:hypothetical protein